MIRWSLLVIPITGILINYVVQLQKPKVKTPLELNPQYDYIIIGGGTAGGVLANRLSENEHVSVLLLEAGGEENEIFYSKIPGLAPLLQKTDFDWSFEIEPQKHCCGLLNRRLIKWPRGKVLGGTSSMHFSHYFRGHPEDFETWSTSTNGLNSTQPINYWAYNQVEPYYRFLEAADSNVLPVQFQTFKRGSSGPISVTKNLALKTTVGQDFASALDSVGFTLSTDISVPVEGYGQPQHMIKNGLRVSSAQAYLRPAMQRSNLHVVTRARVNKITFNYNDEEKQAAGVEFEYHNSKHRVLTNREIILSAGVIGSPQLLMVSGIGPKDHLIKQGIHVIQDSGHVGKNLKDHVGVVLRYKLNQPSGLDMHDLFSFTGLIKSAFEYFARGTGNLAYPPVEYVGFLNSESLRDGSLLKSDVDHAPDVQFYFSPTDILAYTNNILNLTNFKFPVNVDSADNFVFSVGVLLLKPKSSGEVRLRSADGSATHPSIDPNYFENDEDFAKLSKSAKFLDKLLKTSSALQKYNIKLHEPIDPILREQICQKDDMINCLIRHRLHTGYHPTGTCKMGFEIQDSVVDYNLRVHGIKGLRVVDASIFPDSISGNTCATVYMIAEKAADTIKKHG